MNRFWPQQFRDGCFSLGNTVNSSVLPDDAVGVGVAAWVVVGVGVTPAAGGAFVVVATWPLAFLVLATCAADGATGATVGLPDGSTGTAGAAAMVGGPVARIAAAFGWDH